MASSLVKFAAKVNPLRTVSKIHPVRSTAVRYGSSQKRASFEHTTLNLPETRLTTLKNGLRVASEDHGLPTCTIGVWIDAGSRFEDERTNGTAHFLEHLAFKGTKKRSQQQLEKEAESKGLQLSACAAREHIVYHAKCLSKDLESSVEILADVLQNGVYSEEAIERERGMILREMQELETNFEEVVKDYLHATAYQGTPLGQPVTGSTENVKSITRKNLTDYVQKHYRAPRIVLAGAGGVQHERLVELANRHFGSLSAKPEGEVPVVAPCRYTGSEIRVRDDDVPLAHIAVAVETAGWSDADNVALKVAMTLVGSWDRTAGGHTNNACRLASRFAEEQAPCQLYSSFNLSYTDTGLWGTYFVADRFHLYDTWQRIVEEWKRLAIAVTDFEVERAKNQLKTNYLIEQQSTGAIADGIGRQVLVYGRRIPIHEINARIDAVDAATVKKVINKYVYDRDPVIAAVGPVEDFKAYNRTRADMYWMRK